MKKTPISIGLLFILGMMMYTGCSVETSAPTVMTSTPTVVPSLAVNTKSVLASKTKVIQPTKEKATLTLTPTKTPSPTSTITEPAKTERSPLLQLTYISSSNGIGSERLYSIDIFCMELDKNCFGTPQLLFQWDEINFYDWSPDGKRIAFNDWGNLYIADWDGTNKMEIQVSQNGSERRPKWSPDGQQVAFIYGSEHDPEQIKIYDIETGEISTLFPELLRPRWVGYLSGGEMVYVAEPSLFIPLVRIVKRDGTVLREFPKITETFTSCFQLSFSPDEKQIAFDGEKNRGNMIFI